MPVYPAWLDDLMQPRSGDRYFRRAPAYTPFASASEDLAGYRDLVRQIADRPAGEITNLHAGLMGGGATPGQQLAEGAADTSVGLFDERAPRDQGGLIEILKKYGLAGLLGGTGDQ